MDIELAAISVEDGVWRGVLCDSGTNVRAC